MSAAIKAQSEDPELSISEDDLELSLRTFVKGMNAQEVKRFKDIYSRFQDKSNSSRPGEQRQI